MPHDTLVEKPVMLKLLFTRKASRRGCRINGTEAPVSSSCTTKSRGKPHVLQPVRGSACTKLGRHWAACFRVKCKACSLPFNIAALNVTSTSANNVTSSRVLPQNCTIPQTCSGDRFPTSFLKKVLACTHVHAIIAYYVVNT